VPLPKPRRVVVGVALAAMLGALVAPADAQTATPPPTTTTAPSEKLSSVEQQLRDAYDDASAQEAATLDAYKASLEKTAQIEAQLAELDSAIATVSGYLDAAQGKVAEAQAALTAGEARRAEVEKALTIERARLDKRAISAYVSGDSRQVELEAILGASELRELESTHAYSSAIVDDQLDAVLKVKALEAEATAIRDRLAAAAATIRDSRDKIAASRPTCRPRRRRPLRSARRRWPRLRTRPTCCRRCGPRSSPTSIACGRSNARATASRWPSALRRPVSRRCSTCRRCGPRSTSWPSTRHTAIGCTPSSARRACTPAPTSTHPWARPSALRRRAR
jgi:hypothetical protein